MGHRHLSELRLHDQLDSPRPDAHLASCEACQARLAQLQAFTRQLAATDEAAFAQAFPDARVAASRDRVLAVIDDHRTARVVPFPGAVPPAAPSLRARPRWMAAAAAGLIVGIALGRWTHWGAPVRPVATSAPATISAITPAVYLPGGDDDLLSAIEAVRRGPIAELRSLHELTPLAEQYDTSW